MSPSAAILRRLRPAILPASKSARSARRYTPAVPEALDRREVPATGVTGLVPLTPVLYAPTGVLTVIGNGNNNTISVTASGANISVLGKSFAASKVKMIVIAGEGGNDTIKVSTSVKIPTILYGGSGSDTITGGGGKNTIYGGGGADKLVGGPLNDVFYTGPGSDSVSGGSGSDSVLDASSSDHLTSASGNIGEDPELVAYSSSSFKGQVIAEVLRLVNLERSRNGLKALKLDPAINSVAADLAATLSSLSVPVGQGISHAFSGYTRPTLSSRFDANLLSFSSARENNGYVKHPGVGAKTLAKEFMYGIDGKHGLMNSSGHRANILAADVNRIGLGLSGSSSGGYYLSQDFAKLA